MGHLIECDRCQAHVQYRDGVDVKLDPIQVGKEVSGLRYKIQLCLPCTRELDQLIKTKPNESTTGTTGQVG